MVFFVTAVDLQLVEDLQIWLQNTSAKQHFTTIRVKSKVHANKSHKETYCQTLSEYRSKELLKKNFQESFFFFFFFFDHCEKSFRTDLHDWSACELQSGAVELY